MGRSTILSSLAVATCIALIGVLSTVGSVSARSFVIEGSDSTPSVWARPPELRPALDLVSPGLRASVRGRPAGERVRVIVLLESAPGRLLMRDAHRADEVELREIDRRVRNELRAQSLSGEPGDRRRDADRHPSMQRRMPGDIVALREMTEEREVIARRIDRRRVEALRAWVEPEHRRLTRAFEGLGALVERALFTPNALVALVPVDRLDAVAALPGVARLAEDTLEIGHLTNADDATRASDIGGLWANGHTGGTFDPGIVDNGVDRTNPLLVDELGYTNFWLYSLTAAQGDPGWADALDEDDRQGHGTHVQGIVASHGSVGHPTHLGLSYGVAKVVQLKAGFCCVGGNSAMYASDRQVAIDTALNSPTDIASAAGATGTFVDDIDGLNISYGGSPGSNDDTDSSRFIDAVIDASPDLPITISAGNGGPGPTTVDTPGIAYNAITVANVDDQGTATRADDVIATSSARGPTFGGRRKPDLAAPGTAISSANSEWETEVDVEARSGTSMAAPMVLGVLMDLMEAGVTDELELKALLINTAQKNDTALDFESDADGWDPAYGWGYMNSLAAYGHRVDVRSGSVTPDGQSGDYVLYAGEMQDEGSAGEGRDRATLVWNRHADYNGALDPTTYYSLSDLDLWLYDEDSGVEIDSDLSAVDNVHQVRIDALAPATPVIVRVDAASASFPSGDLTEAFALATEEGFTQVDLPDTFPATASWPMGEVEPGEQFTLEFWVTNQDAIASHANMLDLNLPAGFVLDAGADPFPIGSVAGGGTESNHAVWMITAGGSDGVVPIGIDHTHTSYLEPWGPGPWAININVVTDDTPPSPGVMSFSIPPGELSSTQLTMRATTATDTQHEPVEYQFSFVNSPSGGAGGAGSSWTEADTYVNNGLQPNHEYCYTVQARDSAQAQNENTSSPGACDYTAIETPTGVEFGTVTATSIEARSTGTLTNLALDGSGVRISNDTQLQTSAWDTVNAYWTSSPLGANTPYSFTARARNGDGAESPDSPPVVLHTLALPPLASGFGSLTDDSIEVFYDKGSNPMGTELQIENTDTMTTSPWAATTTWTDTGLLPNTSYSYTVRARNGDGVPTSAVAVGSSRTWAAPPSLGVVDSITQVSATANWTSGGNPMGTEYLIENTTDMTTSGWTTSMAHPHVGLLPNTAYDLRLRARNADLVMTAWVDFPAFYTLAEAPTAEPFGPKSHFSIEARWGDGGNPAGTEYLVENTTDATNSGWITQLSWQSTGLDPATSYDFQVKARNGDGVETDFVVLGTEGTLLAPALPLLSWGARMAFVVALTSAAAFALRRRWV